MLEMDRWVVDGDFLAFHSIVDDWQHGRFAAVQSDGGGDDIAEEFADIFTAGGGSDALAEI
jgi:hypothetical protein